MSDEDYELCPSCTPRREAGEYIHAMGCHGCGGKGIRRKPSLYLCNGCGGSLCPSAPTTRIAPTVSSTPPSRAATTPTTSSTRRPTGSRCASSAFEVCSGQFQIKPQVSSCVGSGRETYEQDEAAYRVRIWREKKGHLEKLSTGYCNATEDCEGSATVRHFVSGHLTDEAYCAIHAANHTYGNSRWISEELCAGIPLDAKDRTEIDKQRLIEAYLSFTMKDRPTWFRFVSECVRDVVNCPEETGAIWVPEGLQAPEWLMEALGERQVIGLVLTTGRLFYGSERRLFRFGSRYHEEMYSGL